MRIARKLLVALFSFISIVSYAQANEKWITYNIRRGAEAIQKQKYDEALEYLEKEISENPKNGYAYMLIASINEDENKHGEALTNAELAFKYLPKKDKESHGITHMTRGTTYLSLEDTVKALADFTASIKLFPEGKESREKRAYIYRSQKKYDLSNADFEKIISLYKGDVSGYMGIGYNCNEQKKWDEAIDQFSYVIRMYPSYAPAYTARAESYIGKKNFDKATDDLMSALKKDNDKNTLKVMCSLEGSAYTKLKEKLQIQAAIEKTSSAWDACNGLLHENKRQFKQARKYYEEANKREPHSGFLERISTCYYYEGLYEKSLEIIEKALNMAPQDKSLLTGKAKALYQLEKTKDAIVVLDSILSADSEYAIGYFHRAKCKKYLDDYNGAIDDYNMAISVDPKSSYLYSARAYMYNKVGKADLAKKDYEKVVELEKNKSDYDCCNFAYLYLGDTTKAKEVMDSLLVKDTLNPIAYYNAACFYARMNKTSDALSYLENSFQKGFRQFVHIKKDFDLDPLRELPEFKTMVKKYSDIAKEEALLFSAESSGQVKDGTVVEVPFTKDNGSNLCIVKCTINNLPLSFIFDTGASIVSLSQVEATFMMKNGYLSKSDVIGDSYYTDASGNVNVGTTINLKKVDFGGFELTNVKASVVKNQNAPLLLGQSVLGRLGKIEIDNSKHVLKITTKSTTQY